MIQSIKPFNIVLKYWRKKEKKERNETSFSLFTTTEKTPSFLFFLYLFSFLVYVHVGIMNTIMVQNVLFTLVLLSQGKKILLVRRITVLADSTIPYK